MVRFHASSREKILTAVFTLQTPAQQCRLFCVVSRCFEEVPLLDPSPFILFDQEFSSFRSDEKCPNI